MLRHLNELGKHPFVALQIVITSFKQTIIIHITLMLEFEMHPISREDIFDRQDIIFVNAYFKSFPHLAMTLRVRLLYSRLW